MKNIIAASNDFASTKKEMMSIAQGILDMNIESRKDYAAKYEELVKENELSDSADTKNEIYDINTELKELRSKLRICNNILEDAERIQIRYNRALELDDEAKRQDRDRNRNQLSR